MGGGGITIGYGFMDVSKLHAFVPDVALAFKNDFIVIGGTGHAILNKFVIGGSGFGMTHNVVKTDSLTLAVVLALLIWATWSLATEISRFFR